MTEQSGNTPPPVSSSAPEQNDATVVIAPAGQPSVQPATVSPPPAQPEKPSVPDTLTATERGATLSLTASMTRPALAGVVQPGQSSRSPLWAVLFGALSGLLLFALTAMLLMNR